MPEHPNPKLREAPPPGVKSVAHSPLAYAELDVKTNFSFLRGASHPDELVYRAAELGYRAIAVTDVNSLAGVVRAHEAAREVGLKLLVGSRLTFSDAPDLLVWATDRAAYGRLCRLLTMGKRRAEKGECELRLEDFLNDNAGLVAAVDYVGGDNKARRHEGTEARSEGEAGGRGDEEHGSSPFSFPPFVPSCLRASVPYSPSPSCLRALSSLPHLSLIASAIYGPDDPSHLQRLAKLSRQTGIPLLATNSVHYHDPSRRALQDVLTCVRHGCTIQEAGFRLFPNGERYLKSPKQMHRLFADYPQAIRRGLEIAEQCDFQLDSLRYEYPDELSPPGSSPIEHLANLAWAGAANHYPHGIPPKVRDLLNHELKLIEQLKFEAYFLTVYDLVRYARSRGILCQGRGSAANSAVCFCIGVTSVNPAEIDLLFERFISAARNEPPDIDIDFEHERREEVIQYIYEKYGRERAGMTAEVITYRGRSAVRDVGKAMGLTLDMVDTMASRLDWWHRGVLDDAQLAECGLDPADATIRRVISLAAELLGFPRHLSQHVGGMVMTRGPLNELVPIENASMPDRTVIEWDKDDIDSLGILKVDVLALGMLTCISKAFRLVEAERDEGGGEIRHEGTKARRHEGTEAQRHGGEEEDSMGEGREGKKGPNDDQDLSGFDCVATGDAAGPESLRGDTTDAGVGAIWADEPNEARGGVNPVEHSRGLLPPEHFGLSEISPNRTGIPCGSIDPARIGGQSENANHEPQIPGFTLRDRPRPTRPHSQPAKEGMTGSGNKAQRHEGTEARWEGGRGNKARRHEGTEARRGDGGKEKVEHPFPSSPRPPVPPPLRASVPPCLRALSSPPSCLRASVPYSLSLSSLPPTDPLVYDMISHADTIGVFQIESRAQMSMLPRLRPRCFYDLVIEVAIVRPGPIQGNMVHPYLRRRCGEEAVTFPSEALRQVLGKTLGVPLFQEQAMRIAMVAAGFSADEADRLRRAMAAWRRNGAIDSFHHKIVEGMIANGYQREFAEQCFNQIKGFGEYGFPESHAASFALLVYVSAWLKRYHPAAFAAALLNSQPMGFYMPAQIVRDAREHGVEVRPADVNESEWDCTLEERRHGGTEARRHEGGERGDGGKREWGMGGAALRLGFRQIKGFREEYARQIVAARGSGGKFASIEQLQHATGLPVKSLRILAEADAFGSLHLPRREALWETLALKDTPTPLFPPPSCLRASVPPCLISSPPFLPPLPLGQEVMTDYATGGLSLKQHPVALIREELKRRRFVTAGDVDQIPHGRWVKVAGLVLIRQRPGTASGIVFETLEDETGIVNLIVKPEIYDRYRPAARHAALLGAEGYLQRQGQVVHVLAKRLTDLSDLLSGYEFQSRDFH